MLVCRGTSYDTERNSSTQAHILPKKATRLANRNYARVKTGAVLNTLKKMGESITLRPLLHGAK
jgi:hypothetical protein